MGKELSVKSEKEESLRRPIYIFGKDITEIKCFRNSLICGICTGVAGGLACFLGTSKTLFSTHIAFASVWIGVFAYWIPCRYKYESKILRLESAREKRRAEKYAAALRESEENKEDAS